LAFSIIAFNREALMWKIAAIVIVVVLSIVGLELFNPITRSDLGIAETNLSPERCAAPKFTEFNLEFGTREKPSANYERVSNEFLPYAVASLNGYRRNDTLVLSNYDRAWKVVDMKELGIHLPQWNGFDFSVYSRDDGPATEVLVAFRGTDGLTFDEWFAGVPDWIFGNGSWFTQWVPWWDQYRSARRSFQSLITWAKQSFGDRPVYYTVTGHSLGGGLAQHIARAFPCVRAVSFNSSCVTNEFRLAAPFRDAEIVLISEDGDPLTRLCKWVFDIKNDERTHVYFGANMVLKREKWLTQHSMDQYSAGMSRMVVCCAQRTRLGQDNSCKCTKKIEEGDFLKARRLYCGEHNRTENDIACDNKSPWTPRYQQEDCVNQVRNC